MVKLRAKNLAGGHIDGSQRISVILLTPAVLITSKHRFWRSPVQSLRLTGELPRALSEVAMASIVAHSHFRAVMSASYGHLRRHKRKLTVSSVLIENVITSAQRMPSRLEHISSPISTSTTGARFTELTGHTDVNKLDNQSPFRKIIYFVYT